MGINTNTLSTWDKQRDVTAQAARVLTVHTKEDRSQVREETTPNAVGDLHLAGEAAEVDGASVVHSAYWARTRTCGET